ncbi:M48 family metalloprotease [Streptomyces sp. NPDC048483]|uniref:M48 family metalloprotease n=1 Tax=Streptomyces sp. NPDC048483 TaxID=3154927 RepID=UPI003438CDE3
MIAELLVPLLVPFVVPALAERCVQRLAPVTALWLLTLTAILLAGSSLVALGSLVLTGLLKLPVLAMLGELIHPLHTASDFLVLPAATAAVGALSISAWTLTRSALRQIRALRTAHRQADSRRTAGDLCVIDSPYPDAYALPGRPSRIVVTTAMIRSLDPAEREALFAHERAHNAGRHHYFLATAELAAQCHPGLRPARAAIRLAAERAADEAAAAAVGDRRLAARAIARAALATDARRSERPIVTPAATTGPVPQRVTALLAGPRTRTRRTAPWIALLLAACAATSACTSATGAIAFHHEIEVAQGEAPR